MKFIKTADDSFIRTSFITRFYIHEHDDGERFSVVAECFGDTQYTLATFNSRREAADYQQSVVDQINAEE